MSVESTALSRAKLEQKDRAELAAIVDAMGGKAGSCAKKADLVELVLQLAGAAAPQPSPEAAAAKAELAPPGSEADATQAVERHASPAGEWAAPAPSGTDKGPGDGRLGARQQDRQGGQPGAQGQRGEDGEPANRRRRRRGRDRDRQGGGAGQGGQGAERQGGQERAGGQGQERGGQGEQEFVGDPIDVEGFLDLR